MNSFRNINDISNPVVLQKTNYHMNFVDIFPAKQKLAKLINKNYLGWDLNNKAKYFRMCSLHLRQDFKSLDYRQKITQVLEKYDFNIQNAKTKKKNSRRIGETKLISNQTRINEYLSLL